MTHRPNLGFGAYDWGSMQCPFCDLYAFNSLYLVSHTVLCGLTDLGIISEASPTSSSGFGRVVLEDVGLDTLTSIEVLCCFLFVTNRSDVIVVDNDDGVVGDVLLDTFTSIGLVACFLFVPTLSKASRSSTKIDVAPLMTGGEIVIELISGSTSV